MDVSVEIVPADAHSRRGRRFGVTHERLWPCTMRLGASTMKLWTNPMRLWAYPMRLWTYPMRL
jgi:hypothetical protein